MENLTHLQIKFPVFRVKKYLKLEKNPLGRTYITGYGGRKILDDTSLPGDTLGERRLRIKKEDRYKLGERVDKLRQLVKYPGGTIFVDNNGKLFQYRKGHKRFKVESRKILKKEVTDYGTIMTVEGVPHPEIIANRYLGDIVFYASVMFTDKGPFIYDYTEKRHATYRKSI
jgi:hypothetical protein